MLEIFTIGGGEYIVNVLNAVAAWCGGGGFRSLLTVVMVIGLMYSLLVVAFSMNWRMWLNWFLGATLMYGALIVPTTSVKVTDRLNPALPAAVVDNVPVGLAVVASISSQTGDWMTRTAETVFTMPEALKLSTNGMIYGSRLFDRTRQFRIRDPRAKANVEEYIRQCLFYDFMLGHKDMAAVANSADLLTAIGPGSPARGMRFVRDDNTSEIRTCNSGYATLANTTIPTETTVGLLHEARRMYPNLSEAAARTKLDTDLPLIGNAFFGSSQTAQQHYQQRALVDVFLEARANLGGADGDSFAIMRADEQARNTYTSIADQAMTWVPLLNIVLTVVFYAMFPVIFPLFLLPQTGVPAVKGYFTGFFYLAAWGPLYAVLHMFIMDRTAKGMQAVTDGAVTMATLADIDAVNADTATIAGFMMMSIPFLAAGMAKGAMAISSQATSMLAPAQSAAEAAAVERTTGNYSYGNTAFQNLTGNVRQADQFNSTPSFSAGFGRSTFHNQDGTTSAFTADGSNIVDSSGGMSRLPFSPQLSSNRSSEISEVAGQLETRRDQISQQRGERISFLERNGYSFSQGYRTAFGTEASSGVTGGSNNQQQDRTGVNSNDTFEQGRQIAGTLTGTQLRQDQMTTGLSGNINASVGGGGGGGGGNSGGKGRGLGIGGQAGVSGSLADFRADSQTRDLSDRNTDGANSTTGEYHDNGTAATVDNGTYYRSGPFSRSENSTEERTSVDRAFEELRSLDRQAQQVEDVARTLGINWTTREGRGTSMTEDMSQVVAARYYEYAERARAENLDVPLSPTQTNVTPAQQGARHMIVDKILDDYIDEAMAPVRAQMVSPTEVMGKVQGPSEFGEAELRAQRPGMGVRQVDASAVSSDVPTDVTDRIEGGATDLGNRQEAAIRQYGNAQRTTQPIRDRNDDRYGETFFDEGRSPHK